MTPFLKQKPPDSCWIAISPHYLARTGACSRSRSTIKTFILLLNFCLVFSWARAETAIKRNPGEVLLLANANSPISLAIADDYARKRNIKNRLSVQCQDSALNTKNETISLTDYVQFIENPIRAYLAAHTNIDFIVLTKGMPIRITGAAIGSCDEHRDRKSTV